VDPTLAEVRETREVAEDGQAVDAAAMEVLVVVEEADRFVSRGLVKDVENDATVATRAEDDDFGGHGFETPPAKSRAVTGLARRAAIDLPYTLSVYRAGGMKGDIAFGTQKLPAWQASSQAY
jgi:hypothetical protein